MKLKICLFDVWALNGSSYTQMFIDKGYATNDEGFGWTNASVLKLAAALERIEGKVQADMKHGPRAPLYIPEKQKPVQQILAREIPASGQSAQR